jgi:hypothetical protein
MTSQFNLKLLTLTIGKTFIQALQLTIPLIPNKIKIALITNLINLWLLSVIISNHIINFRSQTIIMLLNLLLVALRTIKFSIIHTQIKDKNNCIYNNYKYPLELHPPNLKAFLIFPTIQMFKYQLYRRLNNHSNKPRDNNNQNRNTTDQNIIPPK